MAEALALLALHQGTETGQNKGNGQVGLLHEHLRPVAGSMNAVSNRMEHDNRKGCRPLGTVKPLT